VSLKKLNEQRFCGWCGSDVRYLSDWVSECPNCSYKKYINPAPCVEVIIQQGDKILAVRRAINPSRGKFDLPGGFMDIDDESLEQAAYREIKEEVGLDKEDVSEIKFYKSVVFDYQWQDTTQKNVISFFRCKLKSGPNAAELDKKENSEMIWVSEQDILELDFAYEQERELLIKFYKGE
jgi:NAD+ diphosphatase